MSSDCCSHKQPSAVGFLGLFPADVQSHIKFQRSGQACFNNIQKFWLKVLGIYGIWIIWTLIVTCKSYTCTYTLPRMIITESTSWTLRTCLRALRRLHPPDGFILITHSLASSTLSTMWKNTYNRWLNSKVI